MMMTGVKNTVCFNKKNGIKLKCEKMIVVPVVIKELRADPVMFVNGIFHIENVVNGARQNFHFAHSLSPLVVHWNSSSQLQEGRVDCLNPPPFSGISLFHQMSWFLPVRNVFVSRFLL